MMQPLPRNKSQQEVPIDSWADEWYLIGQEIILMFNHWQSADDGTHFSPREDKRKKMKWITKDGRRIPLGSRETPGTNHNRIFELNRYIDANAFCPICRSPVVYYQNENGSKVFFNRIGWPWEKHECTDHATIRPSQDRKVEILGRLINLLNGETIESLSNGYLLGHYDVLDETKNFFLLRLKNSKNQVMFVECSAQINHVAWDTLHDAPFFLRRTIDAKSQEFLLWFFARVGSKDYSIQHISVQRTTIPFEECVSAFKK